MRILVIAPRFPAVGGKGDQMRSFHVMQRLSGTHDLRVVTAAQPPSDAVYEALREHAQVTVVSPGRLRRVAASAAAGLRGRPLQIGFMMPTAAWRRARAEAEHADVVLAVTARALRQPLRPPVVLDHIDALSLNMRRRARGPEPLPVRALAAIEGILLRRWERRVAGWVTRQVVTSPEDAAFLPPEPGVDVVPIGWEGEVFVDPPGHVRDLDLILTGNMRYPPNRDAAEWLSQEIMPRIRRVRPDLRAAVVGRAADRLQLDRLEVHSDVPDLHAYLRRARVAIVPLRRGTGVPYKILEAAANGAAVVATPWAAERFGIAARAAPDADGLARGVIELLADQSSWEREVTQARASLERYTARAQAERIEAILRCAAGSL